MQRQLCFSPLCRPCVLHTLCAPHVTPSPFEAGFFTNLNIRLRRLLSLKVYANTSFHFGSVWTLCYLLTVRFWNRRQRVIAPLRICNICNFAYPWRRGLFGAFPEFYWQSCWFFIYYVHKYPKTVGGRKALNLVKTRARRGVWIASKASTAF